MIEHLQIGFLGSDVRSKVNELIDFANAKTKPQDNSKLIDALTEAHDALARAIEYMKNTTKDYRK